MNRVPVFRSLCQSKYPWRVERCRRMRFACTEVLLRDAANDRLKEGDDMTLWFNGWGLLFVTLPLIPNILFAWKCKNAFEINEKTERLNAWSKSVASAALRLCSSIFRRRAGLVVAGGAFHFIRLWMRRLSFFTRYWGGLLSQKQVASGDSAVVHSFGAFPVQRDYPSAAAVDVHGGNFPPCHSMLSYRSAK